MDERLAYLWAKTGGLDGRWHPLVLHLLDVAAAADCILRREPESSRDRLARTIGLSWERARPWLLLIVACHDLGKAAPGFQYKWPGLIPQLGLSARRSVNTDINHAFISQIELNRMLQHAGWPAALAELVSDAAGCHHGERASPALLERLEQDTRAIGAADWMNAREQIFAALVAAIGPDCTPRKPTLSGPEFMLLAGLTSFADWIGSNEAWFPFGTPADSNDLPHWFSLRHVNAERALDGIGWLKRTPLLDTPASFEAVFGFAPRPLQIAMSSALDEVQEPALILVEAPMGEGKTEAALLAHLELQRRFDHRGLYVALPTKATGNAMFTRVLRFLRGYAKERYIDLQLLHGAAQLNETFQFMRLTGVHDMSAGGEVRAAEWFTHKKRALLSEYGVGTADQAIVPILPVRHNFVRLWGLANRVVIFDEVHAYDAYTSTLLHHLLRWLLALGSSVVLLSATLSPSVRRRLAAAVGTRLPDTEAPYPRITILSPATAYQRAFDCDPERRLVVRLQHVEADLPTLKSALELHLSAGGMGAALMNTVQRAQDLYRLFGEGECIAVRGQRVGKRLADGTQILLFHARFPAEQRQVREDHALAIFGPSAVRRGRIILIATQVAEQSLDLDFDVMVTDLAPVDLLLQRAGRLWRHNRLHRPVPAPFLLISGTAEERPKSFGAPLWWGSVYREDVLLRTWLLLQQRTEVVLPDELDAWVQRVYEENDDAPDWLRERLSAAVTAAEGEMLAQRIQANQAVVGLPDDASWNDPARFVLFDEDQPGVHRTLMARTRLGEDSVLAIPIAADEQFNPAAIPTVEQAKHWYMQAVSLSRKRVVKKLHSLGVPEGWSKSPLLRNATPMLLTTQQRWTEDESVALDDELGVVYKSKESA